MPGNTIVINNSDDFSWYMGDSQMDELIEYLDEHGSKITDNNESEED